MREVLFYLDNVLNGALIEKLDKWSYFVDFCFEVIKISETKYLENKIFELKPTNWSPTSWKPCNQ
jgi:hypothetical protein